MILPAALAPLGPIRQWVTYCLTPGLKPGKTDKLPCDWRTGKVESAHKADCWTTFDLAQANHHRADRGHGSGVGFVVTANDPYWFLDIDNCLVDGEWTPLAHELRRRLPGAAVEVSQSGKGLHIIGRGNVPPHRCKNIPLGLELYTQLRFIAITGRHASGSVDAVLDGPIASVIAEYFASNAARSGPLDDWTSEPCEGWAGPEDDDELIRRARATKPKISPAAALGTRDGKTPALSESVSFEALWTADVGALADAWPDTGPQGRSYDASSADASLAMRLAFWTGRDCERIERLMRMSGLMREKYERRDYIERTIMNAAGGVQNVCVDKVKGPDNRPPVDVRLSGPNGEARNVQLSAAEMDDKGNHLVAEFWFLGSGHQAAYDEFADRLLLDGEPLTDATERRAWFEAREISRLKFAKDLFGDMLRDVAYRNRFHPLRDWLDRAQSTWDGVPRLDSWLTDYLGVAPSLFANAVGAIFLTAAVRRARQPGCKFDELLVLEGPQGIEKSTALAMLCPTQEWFSEDFTVSMDSKQLLEATQGKWIVEAPELSKMRDAEIEHVKHLLSRRWDRARMAYERYAVERGRSWVAAATVNAGQYLSDPTGNRRFWPVICGTIDLAALERDRSQLWAEAAQREATGVSIRLPRHLWGAAADEQEARVLVDPVLEILGPALSGFDNGRIQTDCIWQLLAVPLDRRQSLGRKVGDIMRKLGWERKRVRDSGNLKYAYVKGNELPEIDLDPSGSRQLRAAPANLKAV